MLVLSNKQIEQKIIRLAIEILEHNFGEKEIVLLGINNTGYSFAALLEAELAKRFHKPLNLIRLRINPAKPNENPVSLENEGFNLRNKAIIVIDDVANTGRTIFYSFKVLMDILPKKVEVAVLVNRKHKSFPVKVDYMGLELATTVKEHIDVDISEKGNYTVSLN